MKFTDARNTIINELEKYLECPVILSDQIADKPDYPYCYYSVLAPRMADHAFGLHEKEKTTTGTLMHRRSEPVKASLSFTFCSENREDGDNYIFGEDEALELAEKALGFFLLKSHNTRVSKENVVINKVDSVSNRSSFHIEDTIRRYGFDVIISFIRVDEMEATTVKNISSPRGETYS